MKTSLKMVVTAVAVFAATGGPVLAAESSVRDAVRHPIRTMKEKMNSNRADTDRAERTGRSGRTSEMPTYGSSGAMAGAGGGAAGNEQYAADRERTRERARAYVESGGRSGSGGSAMRQGASGGSGSTMRQGTSGR